MLSLKSKNFSLYPRKKHGLVGRADSRVRTEVPFLTLLLGETFLMAPFPIFNMKVVLAKMARTVALQEIWLTGTENY